ncbi:MAG TPA: SH3 domain-containing protein, partial [Archangium sp.]|nr:SH3 domain-containing protein [Archangium sp.]
MRQSLFTPLLWALAGTLVACGGELHPHNEQLVAAMDGQPGLAESLSGQQLEAGTPLLALENANLRREPSTRAAVLVVIPRDATVKVLEGAPRDGFYKVAFAGIQGWSYGAHYTDSSSLMTREQELTSSDIITRAKTVKGFSYWWGHGVWSPGSTSYGACSGSCPSCSHSGSYGADCSGFVAKVWQVPSTNTQYTVDAHPYSTYDFDNTTANWDPISRDAVQPGDAFVQNSDGAGHIFIFEQGDPWGAMWAYECKGCADGCVYNLRSSVSTAYKAIRRRGLTTPSGATSDPSVVTWGTGRLDVFVRGADNALWHKWYDGSAWYAWQSLGGTLSSGPDAASWGAGRLDVFARDTSNNVVQKYYSGSAWSAWV